MEIAVLGGVTQPAARQIRRNRPARDAKACVIKFSLVGHWTVGCAALSFVVIQRASLKLMALTTGDIGICHANVLVEKLFWVSKNL
jgi:hypothetical protein